MWRALEALALGVGFTLGLAACDRVGPHEGYGVLDTSVYVDAKKDAQPVADVVKATARGSKSSRARSRGCRPLSACSRDSKLP